MNKRDFYEHWFEYTWKEISQLLEEESKVKQYGKNIIFEEAFKEIRNRISQCRLEARNYIKKLITL